MTGFGRGVAERGGVRATVDVRAVNHRFLDLKLRGAPLAPATRGGDRRARARARSSAARSPSRSTSRATRGVAPRIDRAAAARARTPRSPRSRASSARAARPRARARAARRDRRRRRPTMATRRDAAVLAALDAALVAARRDARPSKAPRSPRELDRAARRARAARAAALAALAADGPRAAAAPARTTGSRKLLGDATRSIRRALAQEVALLADRADVTEELVRLASAPRAGARAGRGDAAPVGRRLDFLVQEIGRELNTIGSKSAAAEISAVDRRRARPCSRRCASRSRTSNEYCEDGARDRGPRSARHRVVAVAAPARPR